MGVGGSVETDERVVMLESEKSKEEFGHFCCIFFIFLFLFEGIRTSGISFDI